MLQEPSRAATRAPKYILRWIAPILLFVAVVTSVALSLNLVPALVRGFLNREASVQQRGRALIIDGRITDRTVAVVRRELDGLNTIRISSVGGDDLAAIELGQLIRARSLTVVVVRECFGSCAHYIFPAAARKVISEGAVVACGSNIIGAAAVPASSFGVEFSPNERTRLRRAIAFYQSLELTEAYPLVCFRHIATCVSNDRGRRQLFTHAQMWIPSSREFDAFGISNVDGAPTQSARGWSWLFRLEYGVNPIIGELFPLDYSKLPPEQLADGARDALSRIRACESRTRLSFETL